MFVTLSDCSRAVEMDSVPCPAASIAEELEAWADVEIAEDELSDGGSDTAESFSFLAAVSTGLSAAVIDSATTDLSASTDTASGS